MVVQPAALLRAGVADRAAAGRSYRRNIFRSRLRHDRKISTMVTMPLADRYAELHKTTRVCERALFLPQRIPSELELQARWFAGDFGKYFFPVAGVAPAFKMLL